MRILGFSQRWGKLNNDEFTTFRLERRDRDWMIGETVQVYFKPRSKYHSKLGEATITKKELRPILTMNGLTNEEAIADGFGNRDEMLRWLYKTHKGLPSLMNKLTLKWVNLTPLRK